MGVMTEMSRGRFTQGVVVVPEPKLHVIALFFLRSPSKHPPGRLLCICNDKTKQKINFQNLNNNIHQQVMLCQIASDVPENNGDQCINQCINQDVNIHESQKYVKRLSQLF